MRDRPYIGPSCKSRIRLCGRRARVGFRPAGPWPGAIWARGSGCGRVEVPPPSDGHRDDMLATIGLDGVRCRLARVSPEVGPEVVGA